jgi:DNA-binding NarL/FixJ family response regulator
MLTVSRDDRDLFAAIRAGAVGYLLKDMDPRRLPRALESVLEGEVAIPRELVGQVVEEFRDRNSRRRELVSDGPQAKLTSREWEVLELLRQELSTLQIARRLVLSPVTVRTHVNAILRKLELRDREELVRQFPRKG